MRLLNQSITPVFTLSGVSMNINLSIRFLKQLFLIPPPAPKKLWRSRTEFRKVLIGFSKKLLEILMDLMTLSISVRQLC